MKLAFCLYKYFPYGGLQRDFMRIASLCHQRGHEIHVYTSHWDGEAVPEFHLHVLKTRGWQNHTRNRSFAEKVKSRIATEKFDLVIGFNKMPHLDMYYAADVCYQERIRESRSRWYQLLPRYRQQLAFEQAVFARGKATKIMLIAPKQEQAFINCYQTEPERFHLLPPGIAKDRIAPPNAADIRVAVRDKLKIKTDEILLLMLGSGFKTKGVDRSIKALAALAPGLKSRCRLFVIGNDNSAPFKQLASHMGVEEQVQFLGGRPDVPDFLLAADLLLHPSYHENTGTVLLEAMASGLAVLTLASCGYAHYINTANAGMVLSSPYEQRELNSALEKMLLSPERDQWRQNGLAYAKQADIYSLPVKAAELIERVGRRRESVS